jgi:bifunctional DNase/RNase
MEKSIDVEVNGIRLEEETDNPIMLLLDPVSNRVLPLWIGTIEAVAIAYAQEGVVHSRPQTHDLLVNIIESLNASISEVCIVDIQNKTYYAEIKIITLDGEVSLSARPSDAIALALRTNSKITVSAKLFFDNSIELYIENTEEIKKFQAFIEDISPDDFF